MIPISSLRTPLASDLQAAITQGLGTNGKAIPAGEMEQLTKALAGSSAGATTGVGTGAPALLTPSAQPAGISSVESGGGSFSNILGQFVNEVNTKQTTANDAVTGMLSGGNVSLHQAMVAMEEANVSFQLMIEVRNKLLDSYQELMRMQV
jgi:flagellar hook-basal body complex protein FliE